MKKLFGGLLLLAIATTLTAGSSGTFWVKEEGPKVSFHILSTLSEKDADYAAWVVRMVLVTQDVTMLQSQNQIQGAKVTPDPSKHELILDFVKKQGSQMSKQQLTQIVTDRLNKGGVQYKEISQPKEK